MAKSSFRIKLSANMRPYVGRVVRGGAVQKAFAAGIGKPVGECVSGRLKGKRGLSSGEVHDAVRACAPAKGQGIPGYTKRAPRA